MRLALDYGSSGYEATMSADAASVSMFTHSHLSFQHFGDDLFGDHIHRPREFAAEHAEQSAILAATNWSAARPS